MRFCFGTHMKASKRLKTKEAEYFDGRTSFFIDNSKQRYQD